MDYCNFAMSPSPNMGNKIHALLVEHDSIDHDSTINMLRCFSYEEGYASSGLSILSKEKAQLDLLISDMSSPDSFGYQLLQLALNINIIVILTSNEEDAVTTMTALEQGALLYFSKPVKMQVVQYPCRQHDKMLTYTQTLASGGQMDENAPNGLLTNKVKVWTEWTVELHDKFVKAARYLGPGRCFPKAILELMNVPGLTRMQVASHLQKCRNAKWLPPHQRKNKPAHAQGSAPLQPRPAKRARPPCYGLMPFINDGGVIETPPVPPTHEHENPFNQAVEGSSMGYFNPDQYLPNHGINGALEMGQIGQGSGMDEAPMYGLAGQALPPNPDFDLHDIAYGDAFGAPAPYVDPVMGQNFSPLPELGFDYYETGQENIVDQAPTNVGNGGDWPWAYDDRGFQSGGNDPKLYGGPMF